MIEQNAYFSIVSFITVIGNMHIRYIFKMIKVE